MNKKEELKKKFEENVLYLQRNIPPDDIYVFTEQTFMAALFFLYKWSEHEDIPEAMENDSVVKKWVENIVGLQTLKDIGQDVVLNLDMESIE